MDKSEKISISVIMPVYSGETTVTRTLECLIKQKTSFCELIVINDSSPDKSEELVRRFFEKNKADFKIINHEKNLGLAKSYNEGIRISKGSLIVTLHQDVIFSEDALEKLVFPFGEKDVVAASHRVAHPLKTWNTYNFWQKCFFARQAGKDQFGIDGKFDCFRKEALVKVGQFDEKSFRSAGEDADLVFRLRKIGRIDDTEAKIIHLHKVSKDFSYRDIIYKQKQYSESRGVLLRKKRIKSFQNFLEMFFRELLLIFLLVPYLSYFSAALVIIYSFWYTKLVYFKEYKNPRIIILPFFNIYLLFVSIAYTFRGFIYGKQKM
jgi:GT2 family glycosyltransferase